MLLSGCVSTNTEGTLASLDDVKFVVKEEKVDGSLEKAMASYEEFLKETPETAMTPEAMRRLADLKIQKEYEAEDAIDADAELMQKTQGQAKEVANKGENVLNADAVPVANSASQATDIKSPDTSFKPVVANKKQTTVKDKNSPIADISESEKEFW